MSLQSQVQLEAEYHSVCNTCADLVHQSKVLNLIELCHVRKRL